MSDRPGKPADKGPDVTAKRIAMGVYLLLVAVVLSVLVFSIWPAPKAGAANGEWDESAQILWWAFSIGSEARMLLLVLLIGALGSYIHAATSFVTYVGNESLRVSWMWWYVLRPFIGMALALLFYFVLRGGLLAGGAEAEKLSLYGIAAVAGLVGMFSKQATDKLEDVADDFFRTREGKGDAQRRDSLGDLVPVSEVMIPVKRMTALRLPEKDGGKATKIERLFEVLAKGVSRIPILSAEGRAVHVTHDSLLYKFVAEKIRAAAGGEEPFDIESCTLEAFLNHPGVESLVSAMAFVPASATLADVKKRMDETPNCRDAFVTQTGQSSEPVLGWLTNIDVGRRLRA